MNSTSLNSVHYLSQLAPGEQAVFMGFDDDKAAYAYRLEALGLLPGTPLAVVRRAPLGDPMQVQVHNATFFLRHKEAARLRVRKASTGK